MLFVQNAIFPPLFCAGTLR